VDSFSYIPDEAARNKAYGKMLHQIARKLLILTRKTGKKLVLFAQDPKDVHVRVLPAGDWAQVGLVFATNEQPFVFVPGRSPRPILFGVHESERTQESTEDHAEHTDAREARRLEDFNFSKQTWQVCPCGLFAASFALRPCLMQDIVRVLMPATACATWISLVTQSWFPRDQVLSSTDQKALAAAGMLHCVSLQPLAVCSLPTRNRAPARPL
jgi:hypothetical protein